MGTVHRVGVRWNALENKNPTLANAIKREGIHSRAFMSEGVKIHTALTRRGREPCPKRYQSDTPSGTRNNLNGATCFTR